MEDVETERSALSLMSFLEVAMRGEDDDIGIAEGSDDMSKDIGIAEAAEKEEKKKQPKKEKKEKKEKKKEAPSRKKVDFMTDCLRHVEGLIQTLDQSYTDEHLGDVLHSTCIHEKDFPLSQHDGFKHKQACDEFADLLVAARDENLKDGTISGYNKFCDGYYEHKFGKAEPKKAESDAKKAKNHILVLVVGGLLSLIGR